MATSPTPSLDSPRAVANKSRKATLLAAIRMALRVEGPAVRRNVQSLNRNRYVATAAIPDYDALKDRAREIKERSIAHQEELVATLEASVKRNGGHFYFARTAEDATRYAAEVCTRHGVRLVVKAKSMTSEEIGLNHVLEQEGIEIAETDLAEFILQIADEQPSHLVGPALHYSRERITELFKRQFPDRSAAGHRRGAHQIRPGETCAKNFLRPTRESPARISSPPIPARWCSSKAKPISA